MVLVLRTAMHRLFSGDLTPRCRPTLVPDMFSEPQQCGPLGIISAEGGEPQATGPRHCLESRGQVGHEEPQGSRAPLT